MENPWLEFKTNPKRNYFVLDDDKAIVDEFNETSNETYRIHTEIMPAPFMGNVLESPIVLLLLNPGFDELEQQKGYYEEYRSYWENELQHTHSVPELPLFCLEDRYIQFSNYWEKKMSYLMQATSKEKVARNISLIQYFPYHSKKYKDIPKKISTDLLTSQKYNFYLVEKAIERKAAIIIMRSRRLWFGAVPELVEYKNLHFTNSYLNTTLSKNNLKAFDEVVEKINKSNL